MGVPSTSLLAEFEVLSVARPVKGGLANSTATKRWLPRPAGKDCAYLLVLCPTVLRLIARCGGGRGTVEVAEGWTREGVREGITRSCEHPVASSCSFCGSIDAQLASKRARKWESGKEVEAAFLALPCPAHSDEAALVTCYEVSSRTGSMADTDSALRPITLPSLPPSLVHLSKLKQQLQQLQQQVVVYEQLQTKLLTITDEPSWDALVCTLPSSFPQSSRS